MTMYAPFAPAARPATVTSSSMSVVDAVQNNLLYDQILQIIEEKPENINEKGWHGFTALHKAALRGDSAIISLLIEHGARVSEPNEFGETPLMYACKRGNPKNIDILLEAGANLDTDDHYGRKAVHHAAAGGSVHTLHYLEQVHGIVFHERDKNGQTALHVTCFQGFQDAVKYLLRKGRSDVMSTDDYGNLPLHIACVNALSETCWTLLVQSSSRTLLQKNKDGKSPLDILQDGKTIGHHYLHKELLYWSRTGDPHLPPKGPLSSWYGLLVMPFVWFAVTAVVGSHLGAYGGVVMTLSSTVLVILVNNQQHRISHISRWTNPTYTGAFAAGIGHTIICYLCKELPVLWPETVNLQLILIIPMLIAMIYMYYHLVVGDPGTCKFSQAGSAPVNGSSMTIEDVAKDRCKMDVFCVTCEIVRPERTKHCRMCGRCITNLDHHCLFLLNCIGRRNHRLFVTFLILATVMHTVFVVHTYLYLVLFYSDLEWWPFLVTSFHNQGWIVILGALNVASIAWELYLVKFQLRLVSYGLTTAYRPMQRTESGAYSLVMQPKDRLRNLRHFFMGRRTYTAVELYQSHPV